MTKKHEWLEEGEGFVDVTLSRALEMDGAQVLAIRLREPVVGDQLASESAKGSDAAKEITMLANLAEIAPDDIKRLPLRDYKRLQTAFLGFID